MNYQNTNIAETAALLRTRLAQLHDPHDILKAPELRALYGQIPQLAPEIRAAFGQEINQLKAELEQSIALRADRAEVLLPIDVTAPFDSNIPSDKQPQVLTANFGSKHPLMSELQTILDIFARMGFEAVESRQLDDDFHMFETLNFPEGHPARDDYDTFMTTDGLIAPAHTSTMQHRVLKEHAGRLAAGEPIAVVIPGRVFRNEDLDATHEHTFYQLEGIYVGKGVHAGNLVATLKAFLEEYYGESLQTRTQPFYFPFTEPSFEFAIRRSAGDWLELLGCGMIHPNVLAMAGIDPTVYTGFAWGGGVDRLVMMRHGIEDVRHFESAKLEFLRQFA